MWPLLGSLGVLAIEASYVPQIVRLFRLKEAHEVSVLFPGLNLFGRLCAFAYAVHLGDLVLTFGFLAGIALRATLLAQVLRYRFFPVRALELSAEDASSDDDGALAPARA